jgi:hypothetical protein
VLGDQRLEIDIDKEAFAVSLTVIRFPDQAIKEQKSQKRWQNVDFNSVKRDLVKCRSTHRSCYPEPQYTLQDFKVIDCTRREVVRALVDCRFVALSYVWGHKARNYSLSPLSLVDDLPQTIEDSIAATQALGFNYLWVDRYVCSAPYVFNHDLMT